MKGKLAALGAVLGIATMGFAGGSGGFDALAEACGLTTLPNPAAEVAWVESLETDLDLTLLAPPDLGLWDASVETHSCVGQIRPGARMTSPAGCTMSWVFQDNLGRFYQTTAGHCVRDLKASRSGE